MTAKRVTVTVVDTTGIQAYIFGSNRLRENIGASYLAAQATGQWVKWALTRLGGRSYILPERPGDDGSVETPPGYRIEEVGVEAEMVYSGGGNTVLLFARLELAQRFISILTERVLREAPGLTLIAGHHQFEWDNTPRLHKEVSTLMSQEVDRLKHERVPSAPLLGLGVTVACGSTGLPAVGMSDTFYRGVLDPPYPVSREVETKLKMFEAANEALAQALGTAKNLLPYDLDNLGRTEGTSSYVAVVHADGNGIGKRFVAAGKDNHPSNRAYINTMRQLSYDVRLVGSTALRTLYQDLMTHVTPKDGTEAYFSTTNMAGQPVRQFQLSQRRENETTGGWYVPFRPLVYGGDDVTFVCDGRIGLGLAARYLELFESQRLTDGSSFTACAGVAVVKSHYPFARSYALSDALCGSAKRWVRDTTEQATEERLFSALDWQIAASGPTSGLEEIRQREYRVPAGNLYLRPLRLDDYDGEWRTWPAFRRVVRAFVEEEVWRGKRNKVIALREALRQGGTETERFLRAYDLLPAVGEQAQQTTELGHRQHPAKQQGLPSFSHLRRDYPADVLRRTGWRDKVCGYFDPIEAMEFLLDPWTNDAEPAKGE